MDQQEIFQWIESVNKLCQPTDIYYCTGTDNERQDLIDQMVTDNMLIKLNEDLRPNSYLARSDPSDVARLESCTYICTSNHDDAGPNNNWEHPQIMKDKLTSIMDGCMANKRMFIIP